MNKIITVFVFLYTIFSFSQVNNSVIVDIASLTYSSNGNSIPHCGEIDLDSEDYVPLTFQVVLTRGYSPNNSNYNNQYGTGTLYIKSLEQSQNLWDFLD